ncbi:hypothetical protein Q7P37_009498 [Cladosporium fusiforme]
MFAPPPTATLSRAEIQARRAQLQAKRASSTGGTSIGSVNELQRSDSHSPKPEEKKKKGGRFSNKKDVEEIRETDKEAWKFKKKSTKGKGKAIGEGGSGTSLPITLLPPPPPPPGPPSLGAGSDAGSFVDSIRESGSGVGLPHTPSPTGRRGKAPPKRPARPSGEMFLGPPMQSSASDSFPRALTPESLAASSYRSASPATPPPFQAPPPIPGAFPQQPSPVPSPLAGSRRLPPLPSPPIQTGPASPPPSTPPPPVPEKSPLRQQRATRPNSNLVKPTIPKTVAPKKEHTLSTDAALNPAMAGLRMQDPVLKGQQSTGEQHRPPYRLRAATAPSEISVLTGIKPIKPLHIRKQTSSSRSGIGSSKAADGEKPSGPTSPKGIVPVGKTQRVGKQGLKRQVGGHHRRLSSGSSVRMPAQKKTKNAPPIAAPKPRKAKKGETLAMLETSGFFNNATGVIYNPKNPNVNIQMPPAASFLDKDLPDTPNSIAPTPTELYQPSRNSLLSAQKSRLSGGSVKRSPLCLVTETDAKSNSAPTPPPPVLTSEEVSQHRLTTILEYKSLSENSPPASGAATPVATQIHLRGGSVVTVTPPELTAWQRSIYIQGPIRLPKPVILPRKNSVASMEPFQEAIDRVYQNALFVPRRRSDDAIVDDVCEFFDEFGFDDIGYAGDLLAVEQTGEDEIDDMDVDEVDETIGHDTERFTTPPGFPVAGDVSPIEKVVAKDVVESLMAKSTPLVVPEPPVPLPPVENEETLRARGIARLSQHSSGKGSGSSGTSSLRKPSESPAISRRTSVVGSGVAIDGKGSILPLLPPPEESMLDAVLEASQGEEADWVEELVVDGDAGGMDWDDDSDVEETDGGASWMSPATSKKKHGLDRGLLGREKRNPVAKMRRFVTTATTIL